MGRGAVADTGAGDCVLMLCDAGVGRMAFSFALAAHGRIVQP